MSSDDEKTLSKSECFELREKRLKLVYKILYVIVAIWISGILSVSDNTITAEIVPAYAFLLATTSLMIIRIIKYALMEFRCMKVIGNIDKELLKQAEDRYDNVWKSFSLVLALSALIMIVHVQFPQIFSESTFVWIFAACAWYFCVFSVVQLFPCKFRDRIVEVLDFIGLFVGILSAYSICAWLLLIMTN